MSLYNIIRGAMSKWEKLIAKLKVLSPDLRFEELEKILLSYGYEERQLKGGSSHYIFKKGDRKIVIPRHKPILRVYIELVRDAIEEEEL